MARRLVPEINSSSMADIAFMLLIFFLVATTMETDKGLSRTLPPYVPPEEQEEIKVIEKNLFVVFLNKNDNLMIEKKPAHINELRERCVDFLMHMNNNSEDNTYPGYETQDISMLGGGQQRVTKAIVSIQNDRGSSYDNYIEVQNEVVAAYNIVRDTYARKFFNKKFDDLNEDEYNAIKELIPQKISEAEPKNIGG
ncbi:MAG: biopolymer transporter ExbD [Bacteroidales bacterium]|jgi:biopolymer transport protein ExbD|nr:biopolymer transporter ExbD [Bacteroidales bacterium]